MAALVLSSCVNEKFTISEEKLDTEVQVFQEGLSIPLGSTDRIKLKDLLSKLDEQTRDSYLEVLENGAYALKYSQALDYSETINDAIGSISIDAVDFSESFDVNLEDIDVSGVSVPEMWLPETGPYQIGLSDFVEAPDLPSIKPVTIRESYGTDISGYGLESMKLDIPVSDITSEARLFLLDSPLPPIILNDTPISITPDYLDKIGITYNGNISDSRDLTLELELPEGIESINELVLNDKAAVNLTVELIEPVMISGYIVPDLRIDLSDFLVLETPGSVINVADQFKINAATASRISRKYAIKGLAIDADGWKEAANGKKVLAKPVRTVSVDGKVGIEDCVTTTNLLNSVGGLKLKLSVAFENLEVKDVDATIKSVSTDKEFESSISIEAYKLPEAIESIDRIAFDDASMLTVSLQPRNLSAFKDLDIELSSVQISFPQGLTVKDELSGKTGNTISTDSPADLHESYSRNIRFLSLDLPAAVDGKIAYEGKVHVKASFKTGGRVLASQLQASSGKDVGASIAVTARANVSDYTVHSRTCSYEVSQSIADQQIVIDVPESFGKLGTSATIYPEGNPVISVKLQLPSLPTDSGMSLVAENLKFRLPSMLNPGSLPQSYSYNSADNSITINGVLPSSIEIPVRSITVKPEYDESIPGYCVKGVLSVSGKVALTGAVLSRGDVDNLLAPDNQLSMQAHIPAMSPSKLEISSYGTSINENFKFDIDLNLPEDQLEIKEIKRVELKDVYFNVSLDASSLTSRIDADIDMSASVTLPDVLELDDPRVDANGVLTLSGKLKDGKLSVEPVKVSAINLSGKDPHGKLELDLGIAGNINVNNADIDIDALSDGYKIAASAGVGSLNSDKILLKSVSGKVSYKLDDLKTTVDLSALASYINDGKLEAELDLKRYSLAIDLLTGMEVPVSLAVNILPYYNGIADQASAQSLKLAVNTASSDGKPVSIWISNTEEGMPAGYQYKHFDILPLVKSLPEKIDILISGGIDSDKELKLILDEDQVLKADCKFCVPLELGEEFAVSYRDTLRNIPETVSRIFACGDFELAGEVENGLPLGVELNFALLDENDRVIELSEDSGVALIPSCQADGSPSISELSVRLVKKAGSVLPQIKSIEVLVKADPGNAAGLPMTEEASLKGKFRAILPSGISLDLKDVAGLE